MVWCFPRPWSAPHVAPTSFRPERPTAGSRPKVSVAPSTARQGKHKQNRHRSANRARRHPKSGLPTGIGDS
eukprot:3338864-Pyramimonas_sp.AAC.1